MQETNNSAEWVNKVGGYARGNAKEKDSTGCEIALRLVIVDNMGDGASDE